MTWQALVKARVADEAPNPSTDARVAGSEGSAQDIINEAEVEALR